MYIYVCIFVEILAPKYQAYVRNVKLLRAGVLKLWDPQKFPGDLVKTKIPGPHPRDCFLTRDGARELAFRKLSSCFDAGGL